MITLNITVIGAGAIGGYFGARLVESGLNVTFLDRERRAEQLRTRGLVVKSVYGDFTIKDPRVVLDSQEIPHCDLVLFCLKNYQMASSFPHLKDLVSRGAKILPLSNGVEHFEILAQEFGQENVIGGNCKTNSTLDAEGNVVHSSKLHKLIFGEIHPSQKEFCLKLQQTLAKANVELIYSENMWVEIWVKYAFITVFAGVTTAGNLTTDIIYENEVTREMFRRALEEVYQLAEAYGAKLPDDYVSFNVESLAKYPKGTTTSMHQDLKKGVSLEVESLQGAAVRLAARKNLKLPVIETLYCLIKPHELGQ